MAGYIELRRRRWYALMEIPGELRPRFGGKRRFVKSLETTDKAAAERRKHAVFAEWARQLSDGIPTVDFVIRGETHSRPLPSPQALSERLRDATTEAERAAILEEIESAADHVGAVNVEKIGERPSGAPEAQRFYKRVHGSGLVGFTNHLDEWLATSRVSAKTKDMQRSDVERFAAKFPTIADVIRPEVRRWITGLMNGDGLTPKTVQRILSALRGYWRYLQSINVAGEDQEPFAKLDVARQAKRADPRSTRQPFEPAAVVKLLKEAVAREDSQLADLIRLGMWTGCRIEELCALKVEKVKAGHFSVEDAKTAAGWRDVPIHPKLAPVMRRLVKDSKDGYVLSGLPANKYGDRSNAVGKRFGRLKSELGYGPQLVFHSIRKTVITILENAGVPENVVADIVGHEKGTVTYGLYSGGVSLAVKREALAKLRYPGA